MIDTSQLALLILPMTLLLLSGAFGWLWRQNRIRISALAYCISFGSVAIAFTLIVLTPRLLETSYSILVWIPSLIGLSTALWGLAISQLDETRFANIAIAVLIGATALCYTALNSPVDSFITSGEICCLIFYCFGAFISWCGHQTTSNRILRYFMLSGALLFSIRLGIFFDGYLTNVTALTVLQSDYFLTLQFFSSIVIIGSGLSLLAGEVDARLVSQRTLDLTDPLSGLITQRGFWGTANGIIKRARSNNRVTSLILCDIDHFKAVNDTHGHLAGDTVIKEMGNLINGTVRETDLAARVGGEEFALLLPGATIEVAADIAERLRKSFSECKITEVNNEPLTVSFGVTAIRRGDTIKTGYQKADAALYKAKKNGRNQVFVSTEGKAAKIKVQNQAVLETA